MLISNLKFGYFKGYYFEDFGIKMLVMLENIKDYPTKQTSILIAKYCLPYLCPVAST
jgi:hypothetical protein